jgi:gas vesicle protein
MFSRVKIAIRFFFLGLAVGVLLAPRSGEETRRMFREKADRLLNDILDAASLGTTSGTSGSASSAGTPPTEEAAAPRAARTTNGSGTRSRRSSSSASDKSESEAEAEATNASA